MACRDIISSENLVVGSGASKMEAYVALSVEEK